MALKKLKAPESLKIDFCPSPKQYELWKLLQPECPLCGGEVEQMLIGYDANHNPRYKPYCKRCNNQNIPQLVLGGGAAGGGKSFVSSVWLVSSCIRFPDIRAVVARKTLKSLKESTWNTIRMVIKQWGLVEDEHYHINNVAGTLRFWNDSVIIMLDLADQPSDPNFERFGSMEATIAAFDEVSEVSQKAIEVLFSRLRWKTHETFKVSKMLLTTNPTTNWIRGRFVQDDNGDRVTPREGEAYVPFSVFDNPDIAFRQTYEAALNKISDQATKERLLYGNWDFVEANDMAIYNRFDGAVHLVTGLKERVYDPTWSDFYMKFAPHSFFAQLSATHATAVILLLYLFGTVFLHFGQLLIYPLQVVVQRGVVVVREAVLRDDACVGDWSDIERVGFPVVPDIQDFTARKLERRDFLPRHGGELLRHHIPCHCFHIVAGSVDAVTPDVVAYFLLRVLQHDLVGTPDAPVIYHGEILILDKKVIATVPEG